MDEEGVISENAAISREDLDTMSRTLGLTEKDVNAFLKQGALLKQKDAIVDEIGGKYFVK